MKLAPGCIQPSNLSANYNLERNDHVNDRTDTDKWSKCSSTQIDLVSGKDAVISGSSEDNNSPTLEEYLSQLLPRFPWVGMCRLYLDLTTIPKTRFPAFIQLRMNPNPMFKRLTSSMLPVLKNHLETTLSGACFSALRSYMSAKVIPWFQTTPHTESKCLRCSSPESSQVPRIRTHTQVCEWLKKQGQDC